MWGYVVAAIASIQASLYLLVLSVNSIVGIHRGLANAPGELPIWATLALFTTAVTVFSWRIFALNALCSNGAECVRVRD